MLPRPVLSFTKYPTHTTLCSPVPVTCCKDIKKYDLIRRMDDLGQGVGVCHKGYVSTAVGTPGCAHWFESSKYIGYMACSRPLAKGILASVRVEQWSLSSQVRHRRRHCFTQSPSQNRAVWRVFTTTNDVGNVTQGQGGPGPAHRCLRSLCRRCAMVSHVLGGGGQALQLRRRPRVRRAQAYWTR